MPDTIRINGGCAHPWRNGFVAAIAAATCAASSRPAFAEPPSLALHELVLTAQDSIDRHEVAVLVLVLGLIVFTVVTAIMLLRTHARASHLESNSRDQISALRSDLDRANALLFSEPQVLIDWLGGSGPPGLYG